MPIWLLIIFGFSFLFSILMVLVVYFYKPSKINILIDFDRHWAIVEKMMNENNPIGFKQAIIEADKLLDLILSKKVSGENLGLRLKNAKNLISEKRIYNQLWEAHKLRNRLVHELGYGVDKSTAVRTINIYKEFFRKMGY